MTENEFRALNMNLYFARGTQSWLLKCVIFYWIFLQGLFGVNKAGVTVEEYKSLKMISVKMEI